MDAQHLQKQLIVVGGPNGSGKSTFADEYVRLFRLPYLGADTIAAELRPDDPHAARVHAGKLFVRRLREALLAGESVVLESTLSGKGMDKHLLHARALGYQISLIFVTLDSPSLSIARIRERVANGGHHVPDEDVIRRFGRARHHFWQTFRYLADDWQLFSNTGEGFRLVAIGQGDAYEIMGATEFNAFINSLEISDEY
ncbi:MAG: AAA family ATPase [Zoogloea sp.]|uniref:AAA family ATPase n=1 Tax=Zoogloea sp. TaxID=49181 RepID=UPI003F31380D|nr:AAA family ATPase [Rhodocyclales bacterium]